MNREIKFRAWDVKEKQMLTADCPTYSAPPNTDCPLADLQWFFGGFGSGSMFAESNRYILMQYTGLKDKNGKDIYEGDIVKHVGEYNPSSIKNGEIYWDGVGGQWAIRDKWEDAGLNHYTFVGDGTGRRYNPQVKVMGNIYENPELLKLLKGIEE